MAKAASANQLQAGLFRFFRDLKKNNNRDWFQEHKERYESEARDPLLGFIGALKPKLAKISSHFLVDPRPVGGSLFRIYRDTRFSRDKTPYKTHMGAHFAHESSKKGGEGPGVGFYLHLEPGEVFVGAGIWHPAPDALKQIRNAIAQSPAEWKRAIKGLTLGGESLARPPKGFDPEHPLIADIKRKDFMTSEKFTEAQALAPEFLDTLVAACKRTAPLVRFLCDALDLAY